MHILTAEQFGAEELESIFEHTNELRQQSIDVLSRRELATTHAGRQVCTLFYEASTRTRLSFEGAALKLGCSVVSTEAAGIFSSAIKGETLEDTIRVLDEYDFDAIIIRHKGKGSAATAAEVSSTPIINAGDGAGEHPTQALLDAYTINQNFNTLSGLKIVMGGDLKRGRTVRSLAKLLAKYPDNSISFVSIPELQMEGDIKAYLEKHGVEHEETEDMYGAIKDADVVYWTRLQKERPKDPNADSKDYIPEEPTPSEFVIDAKALEIMKDKAIIMHPLPRNDEIAAEVDNDPRAVYFKQAGNGLYVRMALLDQVLSATAI